MGQLFLEFWRLDDPNVVWVLAGAVLLGGAAGVIGVFAFLQKRALIGDALAHAALPGVATAFILFQTRELEVILAGAVVSCALGILAIDYLVDHTRIKPDSALAIVLSVFFAFGAFEMTHIQQMPVGNQAGLDKLLFGQAAALTADDVRVLGIVAALILVVAALLFDRFRVVIFDRGFARAIGMPVRFYDFLLSTLLVLAVVIGLQLAGVVLMAAVILTPAAAARYWSNRLGLIVILAGIFGVIAGIVGANVSYIAPRMPTGPWMVMAITAIFFVSLFAAPERGLYARWRRRARLRRRVAEENVLRTLFKLGEGGDQRRWAGVNEILRYRSLSPVALGRVLRRLEAEGHLEHADDRWRLSGAGLERARAITRRHRLWELYLTRQVELSPDQVHDDAEAVEHLLTPEMERALAEELGTPEADPHGQAIPADNPRAGG